MGRPLITALPCGLGLPSRGPEPVRARSAWTALIRKRLIRCSNLKRRGCARFSVSGLLAGLGTQRRLPLRRFKIATSALVLG